MKRARINEAITSRAVHKKRRRKYSEQREEKEVGSVYSVDGDRGRRRRRRCVINSKNEAEKLLCKENGNRDKFSACMWDIPYILYIYLFRAQRMRDLQRERETSNVVVADVMMMSGVSLAVCLNVSFLSCATTTTRAKITCTLCRFEAQAEVFAPSTHHGVLQSSSCAC